MQYLSISQNQQLQNALKQLDKDSIENVKSSLIPRGISINENAILKLFQDSDFISNQKQWFCDQFFLFVTKTIFGVAPESLDILTMEDIYSCIVERYPKLTVNELNLAYRTHTQDEKVFILTRDIFLKPINEFIRKKLIIEFEIEKELKRVEKEIEIKQQEIEFYNKAKQCYLDSLNASEWQGDMFQAKSIAKGFWDSLFLEERKELQELAIKEIKSLEYQAKLNPLVIVYDKHFYLAQEVIKHSINQRKKFIEI